ncbi:MAG: GNAT family N-acetyltransferase [Rubrivivax sp.]|nr:GNAT family N-acetyltransferase [Rubrivivax sp.]
MPETADPYEVTTAPERFDLDAIHAYLSRSYWSPGIPRERVERAIRHSLGFALLHHGPEGTQQVGFARVVSDRTSFAYLCDVYVLESHQGRGLGKRLIAAVAAHPDLQGLRRFMLATSDAHGLYAHFGFKPLGRPERIMEILDPAPWAREAGLPIPR